MSAFKLKDTGEAVNSSLALFDLPPTDVGLIKYDMMKYPVKNTIKDSTNLRFEVSNEGLTYIDLSRSKLNISGRIRKKENGKTNWSDLEEDPIPFKTEDIAENGRVGIINAFGASLFSTFDLKIGGVNVSREVDCYYGYKAILDILFSGKSHAELTSYEGCMYYPDESGSLQVNDPFSELSKGLLWRSKYVSGSKLLEMSCPIFTDLAQAGEQQRYIINGVKLEFIFKKALSEFCLISVVEDIRFDFEIEQAELMICHVHVPPQIIVGIRGTLENHVALYPIQRSYIRAYSIAQGSLHFQTDSLFGGRVPNLMYMVLVKTSTLQGELKTNPYAFFNENISTVAFYADGMSLGGEILENLNFGDDNPCFLEAFSRIHTIEGKAPNINREAFKSGYCIFVFNQITNKKRTLALDKHAQTRLEIRFSEKTTEGISVLCYAQLNGLMTISSTGVVSIE